MVKRAFIKKATMSILWLLFTIGAVGLAAVLLSNMISSLGFRMYTSNIRFPLGEVSSLVVDQEGRLVVYSTDFARLQIFDSNGKFLKGWYVPAASPMSGSSEMYLDDDQNINLILLNDEYYVFNFSGDVLKHSNKKGIWEKKVHELYVPPPQFVDNIGNKYVFQGSLFFPNILKVNPEGDSIVIVSDSMFILPWGGKIAPVVFFAFPGLILFIVILQSRRKRLKQNIETTESVAVS